MVSMIYVDAVVPASERARHGSLRAGAVVAAFGLAALAASPASAANGWADFRDIGGYFPSTAPVVAVVRGANEIDLFIVGNEGDVYTSRWVDGRDWSGIGNKWRDIGGNFPPGAPVTAISRNPDQLDVFITGNDGHVYTSYWTAGAKWSGLDKNWTDLGGVFPPGAPVTAIARTPDTIDLFITGAQGDVYTSNWSTSSPWSGVNDNWKDIGGVFPPGAPIAAVARNPDQIDLFVTGNQGDVYTSYWTAGGEWTGIGNKWQDIGGVFPAGAPISAISRNPNQIDLFVTGNQGDVYTSWWTSGVTDWTGVGNKWTDIGGVFPAGARVAAASRAPDRIDLLVTGNNGNVYSSWWSEGGDWSGIGNKWAEIGGTFPIGAPLSVVSRKSNQLDAVVTGNDGVVYTSWSIAESDVTPPDPKKPEPTPPPQANVTVTKTVEVYPAPGGEGNKSGDLEKGTQGVTLVEPCKDDWCHVNWPAGDGWVYDGADYDSLSF